MSGQNLYYDLAAILTGAGCRVQVGSINAGWEHRARSSGGFPAPPLAVFWHHTASSTSVESDLSWMIDGCDDAPVGNLLLDRDGVFWPIAAGASNCAGKGGPSTFSRGTIGLDSGNTGGFQIECQCDGVGGAYSQATIDAYFAGSNALNAHVGNQPGDVITHHVWAPTRKIDPATADAVQGPWRPAETTSSGTWSLVDIAAECLARAGQRGPPVPTPPGPEPPTPGDDDVEKYCVRDVDGYPWVTDFASYAVAITEDQAARGRDMRGYAVDVDGGPFPLDEQDSDLMRRLAGQT